MMDDKLHELLLKSLDSPLSPNEELLLKKGLEDYEELQNLKQTYLKQRELISSQEFRFKPFLATRVIAQIEKQKQELGEWIPGLSFAFQRLALPVFAIVLIMLITTIATEQQISIDTILGVSDLSIDDLMNELIVSN